MIDTIEKLMKNNSYPVAFIQGHHSRITMNEEGEYRVYQLADGRYTTILYDGPVEWRAVQAFIDSENE